MNDPIEEFINCYPPQVQAISRELRAMVKKAMPQAGEVLYARHNHFAYQWSDSMRSRFIYICPLRAYVRLGFDYGGHLPDPDRNADRRRKAHETCQGADTEGGERACPETVDKSGLGGCQGEN